MYHTGCMLPSFPVTLKNVEIVLVNEGRHVESEHSIHIHGQHFRLLGLERLGTSTSRAEVQELNEQGLLQKNLNRPTLWDTVYVPHGGYTVVRMNTNVPGYWMLHCHVEYHIELGQVVILKVGDPSDPDWPVIPADYPRCYQNWPEPSDNFRKHKIKGTD